MRMGIAALLPGMRYAMDLMQAAMAEHLRLLGELEAGKVPAIRKGDRKAAAALLEVIAAEKAAAPAPARMSEKGKAAIARAQKARWRRYNAAKAAGAAKPAVTVGKKKAVSAPKKKAGKSKRGSAVTHPYWSRFTPEERKAEMKRRIAVRRGEAISIATQRKQEVA